MGVEVNSENLSLPKNARFFIIKSFTEEDVHRAVKYKLWCSTYYGNRRLESAYDNVKKNDDGNIYLFFSVNASGHFCGIARMASKYNPDPLCDIWCKDEHNKGGQASKWRGQFEIEWVYIKDIPNSEFGHLKVPKNGNKPFPHSRDTQEIDAEVARDAVKIFHKYTHKTSLLDDFDHYNRMEEKQNQKDRAKSYKYGGNGRGSYSSGKGRGSKTDGKNGGGRDERRGSNSRPSKYNEAVKFDKNGQNQELKRSDIAKENNKKQELSNNSKDGKINNVTSSSNDTKNTETRDKRETILSNSSSVFEGEPAFAGVLSMMKPSIVAKMKSNKNDVIGYKNKNLVTVDDYYNNSSQAIEKALRRNIPGQPGPNAIPIRKPEVGAEDEPNKMDEQAKVEPNESSEANEKSE